MLKQRQDWQQNSLGDYLATKIYDKNLHPKEQSKIVQDVCTFDSIGRLLFNGYFQPIFVNLDKKTRMLFIQEALRYEHHVFALLLNSKKYKFNNLEYSVVVKHAMKNPTILAHVQTTVLDLPDKYMRMLYPKREDILQMRNQVYYYEEEE